MTPQEAVDILKNASGMAPLVRNDHIKIMQAVNVLEELIRAKDGEKKDG